MYTALGYTYISTVVYAPDIKYSTLVLLPPRTESYILLLLLGRRQRCANLISGSFAGGEHREEERARVKNLCRKLRVLFPGSTSRKSLNHACSRANESLATPLMPRVGAIVVAESTKDRIEIIASSRAALYLENLRDKRIDSDPAVDPITRLAVIEKSLATRIILASFGRELAQWEGGTFGYLGVC